MGTKAQDSSMLEQSKETTYIYSIQAATGAEVEGFDRVGEVMLSFYKDLLGQTPLVPHITWANTCKAKKHGGVGIKDYTAWNKATIAKLVKWVHGRYIRNKEWWDYSLPPDCSWTWKKICITKDIFKAGCLTPRAWKLQATKPLKLISKSPMQYSQVVYTLSGTRGIRSSLRTAGSQPPKP
ncbi:LOW QUALITY PROTEIN: hypothetical protein Cgig2_001961 [Carnegiea gigantea]|uniref:Uncharacterized protein n=1 Tax=Carnegiea gigantea TaxID=171969 RepID=A0A9Q1Q7D5_9CARY|nr:LOW QUALITY PROTEIN: hypothetical protein Cgig2_001961 [Carnegiea gigantea]